LFACFGWHRPPQQPSLTPSRKVFVQRLLEGDGLARLASLLETYKDGKTHAILDVLRDSTIVAAARRASQEALQPTTLLTEWMS
jgi:hypothetical protein